MTVCLQARKLGEKRTVEALARQFQDQIERILTEKVSDQKVSLQHKTCFFLSTAPTPTAQSSQNK